jgi:hypothetical protein
VQKVRYPTFASYPNGPWKDPTPSVDASVQSVQGAVSTFLAAQANEQLHLDPLALNAMQTTQFTVENIKFAPDGKVSLAVAQNLTADAVAKAFTVYPSMSGSVAEAARRLHRFQS